VTYPATTHTVVETPEYLVAADRVGMTEEDRDAALDILQRNPKAGDIMPDTGGCRKVRVPRAGGGKSGGYRVITYYTDMDSPVILLTVISKGKQANLTNDQKQAVRGTAKTEKKRRKRK
jgi:hypothetical protein